MSEEKLYPDVDPSKLPTYCAHVAAMTAEGLHSKSAIAEQLAWRDAQLAEVRAALERAQGAYQGQAVALSQAQQRIAELEQLVQFLERPPSPVPAVAQRAEAELPDGVLSPEDYEAFQQLLNAPANVVPGLAKAMRERRQRIATSPFPQVAQASAEGCVRCSWSDCLNQSLPGSQRCFDHQPQRCPEPAPTPSEGDPPAWFAHSLSEAQAADIEAEFTRRVAAVVAERLAKAARKASHRGYLQDDGQNALEALAEAAEEMAK